MMMIIPGFARFVPTNWAGRGPLTTEIVQGIIVSWKRNFAGNDIKTKTINDINYKLHKEKAFRKSNRKLGNQPKILPGTSFR